VAHGWGAVQTEDKFVGKALHLLIWIGIETLLHNNLKGRTTNRSLDVEPAQEMMRIIREPPSTEVNDKKVMRMGKDTR
jgi:hypothetical protein